MTTYALNALHPRAISWTKSANNGGKQCRCASSLKLEQVVVSCCPLVSNRCSGSSSKDSAQPFISFFNSSSLHDLTCCVILQGLCCSILWTTQRNGGMCSSAPASVPSGWTTCAVEPGTRSSWLPRTAWARGASVRSLRLRPMEEVRGGKHKGCEWVKRRRVDRLYNYNSGLKTEWSCLHFLFWTFTVLSYLSFSSSNRNVCPLPIRGIENIFICHIVYAR